MHYNLYFFRTFYVLIIKKSNMIIKVVFFFLSGPITEAVTSFNFNVKHLSSFWDDQFGTEVHYRFRLSNYWYISWHFLPLCFNSFVYTICLSLFFVFNFLNIDYTNSILFSTSTMRRKRENFAYPLCLCFNLIEFDFTSIIELFHRPRDWWESNGILRTMVVKSILLW